MALLRIYSQSVPYFSYLPLLFLEGGGEGVVV